MIARHTSIAPAAVRARFLTPRFGAATLSQLGQKPSRQQARAEVADLFGIRATLESCAGCCLLFQLHEPAKVHHAKRRHWTRVARHMGSALRFRQALRDGDFESLIDAIIDPSVPGTGFMYADEFAVTSRSRERLRGAATAIERVRLRHNRNDESSALDAWTELVDGRWTIIERFDTDGRRFYLALRNFELEGEWKITPRQFAVVSALLAGDAVDAVASAWGRSASGIYSLLRAAKRALNLETREELAAFGSGLMDGAKMMAEDVELLVLYPRRDLERRLAQRGLTESEIDVGRSIILGLSNAEIAGRRQTSISTVEKLSTSAFAKVGAGSRVEFIVRVGAMFSCRATKSR